jgi:hypothetical protein
VKSDPALPLCALFSLLPPIGTMGRVRASGRRPLRLDYSFAVVLCCILTVATPPRTKAGSLSSGTSFSSSFASILSERRGAGGGEVPSGGA